LGKGGRIKDNIITITDLQDINTALRSISDYLMSLEKSPNAVGRCLELIAELQSDPLHKIRLEIEK